ncbi:MAG TPA: diguanylate cyclase [Polyangia bacterium]|nr:diguanylate cyclase [Polyangia bacterium]
MRERALILVIDDDYGNRVATAEMIEWLGYRAATAESGAEALGRVRDLQPSMVITDMVMPGVDGFKVAAAIKGLPTFVPVIMMTAAVDLDARRRGHAAGADDFLAKPIDFVELQIRVAALMRIKLMTDSLADQNQRLAELANTDPLTGLSNRRRFEELLAAEHARAVRYRRSLGVMVVDVDHFKKVNDVHGHPVGDETLKRVAGALHAALRNTDSVSRIGGEEFAVIAPELTRSGALALGDRLRRRVAACEIATGGEPLRVTISVGASVWDGAEGVTPAQLVLDADEALYNAKRTGRDRVLLLPVRSLCA